MLLQSLCGAGSFSWGRGRWFLGGRYPCMCLFVGGSRKENCEEILSEVFIREVSVIFSVLINTYVKL